MKRMIALLVGVMFLSVAASLWGEDTGAPPAPSAPAPSSLAAPQVLLDLAIYRVRGGISGEKSWSENGLQGSQAQRLSAKESGFIFFTNANLNVAGVEFCADKNGWTWDGKDRPPSDGRVEQIGSPRVIVVLGESFEIDIGSRQPIEYFERRPDGLFELKKLDAQPLGFNLSAVVEGGEADKIVLRDFTIRLRSIESRVPIEGVSLDVGLPVVKSRESVLSMAVRPDQTCGMLLATEGYGFLLLRLWVGVVTPDMLSEGGRP